MDQSSTHTWHKLSPKSRFPSYDLFFRMLDGTGYDNMPFTLEAIYSQT